MGRHQGSSGSIWRGDSDGCRITLLQTGLPGQTGAPALNATHPLAEHNSFSPGKTVALKPLELQAISFQIVPERRMTTGIVQARISFVTAWAFVGTNRSSIWSSTISQWNVELASG